MTPRWGLPGCCAGAALLLSSCGSGQLARPQGAATLSSATEIEAASVVLHCDGGGGDKSHTFVGVPAALAAIGVDFAVDLVSKLLKDAQEKRNAAWSATGVADNCVPAALDQPITGTLVLKRAVIPATKAGPPDTSEPPRVSGEQPHLATAGFRLVGKVIIVRRKGKDNESENQLLEIRFKEAVGFTYGRTAAATRGSGRKHVVVLLALSSNSPLKGKPVTGAEDLPDALRLDLGTIRDGRRYNAALLSHVQGLATIAAPSPGSASDPRKLLLTAIVVESENELLALKALTDAYDNNKDDLTAALRAALGIKE